MKKLTDDEIKKVKEDEEHKNILIGLAGAEQRTGVTHLSLAVGNYLAEQGHQVAILEMNESGSFEKLREMYHTVMDGRKYIIGNTEFYENVGASVLDEILDQKIYDFVILDMGIYFESDISLFQRCEEQLIISGGKPWEFDYLTGIFEDTEMDNLMNYSFVFTFTPGSMKDTVLAGMGQLEKVYFIEYIEDPFMPGEVEGIEELLQEYLPEEKESRKFSFFGRNR